MEFSIQQLQNMKKDLIKNPSDSKAGKILNRLSMNDTYSNDIFNYGNDGIDNANTSLETVKDRMNDENTSDNPTRKDDVESEKAIIKDIKSEPSAYWFGGGIDEPVDSKTVINIINSFIQDKGK